MAVSVSKTFTAEVLFASELNTNFTDITGGGIAIISPWTGNCDADGFNLEDMGNIIYREESKATTAANQGALYCNVGGVSSLTELFFGGESNRATIPLTLKGGRQTQPTIYLTNKSGGSLAAGDLVIQHTGNDSAVTTTTAASSTAQAFVCLETIANNASGYFLAGPGIVTMTAADAIVRGNFLSTSTTVKRVTDSSTSAKGDFGIALEAASGAAETFEAFFFGTNSRADTPTLKALHVDTASDTWTKSGSMGSDGFVVVHVVGGGGGGGGADSGAAGAGGGGGGHSWKRIAAGSLGSTETVTIGAGGAGGGTTENGGTGGTSSFGSHATATGGVGGDETGGGAEGGRGGVGASGDLNGYGGSGVTSSHGAGSNMSAGTGGSSYLGGGGAGRGSAVTGSGSVGDVYGGGGGGATHNSGSGGAGAAGVVVVEEWY